MEKRFTVLRIIGTVWKVLAWFELVIGVIMAVMVLLMGILGRAVIPRALDVPGGASWLFSVAGGILGFIAVLIGTIIYFVLLYAVGELVYLLLAIEENTRLTSQQVQWLVQETPEPDAVYAPPAPGAYSPPPTAPPSTPPAEEPEEAGPTDRM